MKPQVGDLKVWYVPQVPGKAYEFNLRKCDELYAGMTDEQMFRHAQRIQEAIIGLSIHEYANNIKPDYSDAAGITRLEDVASDDWCEIEDEDFEDQ